MTLCICLAAPVSSAAEKAGSPSGPVRVEQEKSSAVAKSTPANSPEPLSAEELAELSARSEEPGPDVVGGALSNEHLTYVVIALAVAVIVLIAK